MQAKSIFGSAIVGCAMLAVTPPAASQEGAPLDPVTTQVQKCFEATVKNGLVACEKAVSLPTSASTHAHLLIAQALWQEKDRSGSGAPLLRLAVEADPHDTTSRLVLGWYFDRSDRSRAAAEEYREVSRLAEGATENVELDASVLAVLRQSERELGPFFQVLARGFERIAQPRIASAFYTAAILHWHDKADLQIPAMYQAALKLSPSNPALHIGYADYLHETSRNAPIGDPTALQNLKAAAEHLTEAIRLSPEDDRVSYELARIRVKIGDLKGAISEFEEVLRLRPEYPEAEEQLKLAVLASDGPGLAIHTAARPDSAEALSRLGDCIRLNGIRGRVACKDALKLGLSSRNAAKAHLYLAEESSGKEALAEYRAATQADPSFALPFFRLGLRQFNDPAVGSAAEAIASMQKAAELQPQWSITHELLATDLERNGRTEDGIAELQKAIALEPEDELLRTRLQTLQSGTSGQAWAQTPSRKKAALLPASETIAPSGSHSRKLPPRAGLLLALDESSYWLVRDGEDVRLFGELEGILVPRKSGWWRAGIAKPPVEEAAQEPSSSRSMFQQVWALPLDTPSPRTVPQEAPCAGRGGSEERTYTIDWMTSEYAGITQAYRMTCSGDQPLSGQNSYVLPIEALRKFNENPQGTKLPDLAGEPAVAAMREATTIEEMRMAAGLSPFHSGETVSIEEDRWSLRRAKGRWVLERPDETEGQTRYVAFDIPLDAPAKIAGQNDISPAWDLIQEAVPDAVDAFSSPAQDLLVVLSPSRLFAFELSKGTIQKRLLRTPLGNGTSPRTVMVQWATGSTLDKWNQTLLPAFRKMASRD